MEAREALLLRLPLVLKERLQQAAKDHRRSTTREIQVAIESHLKPKVDR